MCILPNVKEQGVFLCPEGTRVYVLRYVQQRNGVWLSTARFQKIKTLTRLSKRSRPKLIFMDIVVSN